ncbi:AMP-dependent synthetase and ligase [Streptomyces graminofaciens]|uniref:AMP-dependent synthetase and ligase n=1 Tax=Streptomyces graminofaciens TaxID=68212 RepID=A0ABN5VHF1_9ACTN|nr:AMP-binding protein [Streptomyces graminofaciens]BBC32391.1 AMP-dependent synthetase and ligase [Streptomyces graminofaciens]
MLDGCTPWPEDVARRYREQGVWRGDTLGTVLRDCARRYGDKPALVHGDRRIGYAELDRWADRLAAGFAAHGVRPGDRVVVQLPNVPEFVAIAFGLMRLGAKLVFSLPAHRASEITHLVELSGAVGYVVPETHRGFDHRELARQVQAATGTLDSLFVLGDKAEGFVSVAELEAAAGEAKPLPEPDPTDVAFFLLSGGTTALPKLIPRTHDDYVHMSDRAAQVCELTEEDVYLAVLPIEFNFAFGCPGVVGTFQTGGTVILADTPNPADCFPLIERHGATVTAMVPSIMALWLDDAEWTDADLSSLRLVQVGGARMPREFTERIQPTLGARLQQVFGMAEGLLTFSRPDDPDDSVLTTQGKAVSEGDEIRIVGEDGAELPAGEIGELLTRGPYTLRGYYRVPEYNKRAFTEDGFYRTGDLALLTADGDLVIAGRIKEMIIRGGDKISAGEVEDLLLAHPAVAAVAVIGVPDEFLGERICAYLVADGAEVPLAELKRSVHARGVADYKLPDAVRYLPELPLTPLGKVDKKALAAHAASEQEG